MSLSGRVIQAAKSNYIGTLVKIAAQLGAQVLIMRLLGPEAIGTFGYILLLYGVLALVIDQGFGWSLIQGDFDEAEVATAFSRLLLASAISAIAVFFLSFPLEIWLGNPLAGRLFRYSAPSYLLIPYYAVAFAKLRKDLRYKQLQYATTGAYLIAYPGVGLGLALSGFGVWSLLVAWYAITVLQIVIGQYYARHSLKIVNPFRPCKAGPLGREVVEINLLNWGVDNASGVVVGGMGASALGNFNAASVLARQPALQLVQTLQSLLFSTASALDGDRDKIRRLYLSALAIVSLIVCPLYGYFFSHANSLVAIVFGSKWLSATDVLAALSGGMIALAVSTVTSSVLTATGGQRPVFYSQCICLVSMLVGLYLVRDLPVAGVGWVITAAYLVRLAYQLQVLLRTRVVQWRDYLDALGGPIILAMIFAIPMPSILRFSNFLVLSEACFLVILVLFSVILLKLFPHFFVSLPLQDALMRTGVGRKFLQAFNLHHPHNTPR